MTKDKAHPFSEGGGELCSFKSLRREAKSLFRIKAYQAADALHIGACQRHPDPIGHRDPIHTAADCAKQLHEFERLIACLRIVFLIEFRIMRELNPLAYEQS